MTVVADEANLNRTERLIKLAEKLIAEPLHLNCRVERILVFDTVNFLNPNWEHAEEWGDLAVVEQLRAKGYTTLPNYFYDSGPLPNVDKYRFELFSFKDYLKVSGVAFEDIVIEGTVDDDLPCEWVFRKPVGLRARKCEGLRINVSKDNFHIIDIRGAEDGVKVGTCKKYGS